MAQYEIRERIEALEGEQLALRQELVRMGSIVNSLNQDKMHGFPASVQRQRVETPAPPSPVTPEPSCQHRAGTWNWWSGSWLTWCLVCGTKITAS